MDINIVPKFLDSALTPIGKEVGERLSDIVSLLFTPVIKAKAKRDKNIEIFLKELDEKISEIPEEKLQEPPLSIVGPAIDNVFKFCHDEEYLRRMYSSLIASSMTSGNCIPPSYVDIIRQLSANDANIFSALFYSVSPNPSNTRFLTQPLVLFELVFSPDGKLHLDVEGVLFYLPSTYNDVAYKIDSQVRLSLESLKRLGLIKNAKYESSYDILQNRNVFIEIKEKNNFIPVLSIITPTYFGVEFAEVCCEKAGNERNIISGEPIKKVTISGNTIRF